MDELICLGTKGECPIQSTGQHAPRSPARRRYPSSDNAARQKPKSAAPRAHPTPLTDSSRSPIPAPSNAKTDPQHGARSDYPKRQIRLRLPITGRKQRGASHRRVWSLGNGRTYIALIRHGAHHLLRSSPNAIGAPKDAHRLRGRSMAPSSAQFFCNQSSICFVRIKQVLHRSELTGLRDIWRINPTFPRGKIAGRHTRKSQVPEIISSARRQSTDGEASAWQRLLRSEQNDPLE